MIFNLFLIASLISFNFASKNTRNYDEFGLTKLHNAILQDQTETIKKLIKDDKSLINTPDLASNSTPLHFLVDKVAVQKGDERKQTIEFIKVLVNNNVDRTIQTDSEWTALNKAVYLASDLTDYPLKVIKILLKDCVAVDKVTNKQTVLHYAAGSRIKPDRAAVLVKLLLDKCAAKLNYDAVDANSWTALKVAIAADNNDVVALLKPKTSSISFVMKIVLAVVAFTILLVAFGIFYYYKISKKTETEEDKPKTTENVNNNCSNSMTTFPPEITAEIDSTTFGSKEKIN